MRTDTKATRRGPAPDALGTPDVSYPSESEELRTYDIALVVEDLDLDDETTDRLLCALPDAVPSVTDGHVTISACATGGSAVAAAMSLISTLRTLFPTATILRVDQDLVSIPDIAQRTGRNRESIRLLADGKRGPGNFPRPVGVVGDAIRVWPWAQVVTWFRDNLGEDPLDGVEEHLLEPDDVTIVDMYLLSLRGDRQGLRVPRFNGV